MQTSLGTWGPTRANAKHWRLLEHEGRFLLTSQEKGQQEFAGPALQGLTTRRVWFRWALEVDSASGSNTYRGLRKVDATAIRSALEQSASRTLEAERDHLERRQRITTLLASVRVWVMQSFDVIKGARQLGRWIPEQAVADLEATRPPLPPDLADLRQREPELFSAQDEKACRYVAADVREHIATMNVTILKRELEEHKEFFATVERTPLTSEQARAVVCFDNRVQLIASAGSGKTSVMVARAAYAAYRGFVTPDRILLLAFNRAAAAELQERVTRRFEALGLDATGIRATTFHAFGLSVIAAARQRKPRTAPWLESGRDVEKVQEIVDVLRDHSLEFRFKWDLFRLIYARVSDTVEGGEPDAYDSSKRMTGFRTANNETVRSEGERIIADFLFFNGVTYSYEHPYRHDTTTRDHSQYRPDFYYPDVDVWHEHWALDAHGNPPAEFTGYAESMRWKKQLHSSHGTQLIETTRAEIIDRRGLEHLAVELEYHGLELDWNPDRPTRGAKPVAHRDVARLIRTFMTHVKSNGLTRETLNARIESGPEAFRSPRTRLFLELYWDIHDAWNEELARDEFVDFEDMLAAAADDIEAGEVVPPYDLVLVDEFQDASNARARIVHALVRDRDKYLLAVGDDWQSVNRFAGADLGVMTNFEEWFGRGHELRLETTFRCTQTICDVAGAFVAKNPRQLSKHVASVHDDPGPPVLLHRVADAGDISSVIEQLLQALADDVRTGVVEPGREGRVTVDVLGRYTFDRDYMPGRIPPELVVNFRTAHSAKGLEADYVIVPNLLNGTYGFPSQIVDDPVLDLAMSDPDDYPHAEERRLFYVALTRARRQVLLLSVSGRESPFVVELLDDGLVTESGNSAVPAAEVCPKCSQGTLVLRSGPYGQFHGCSTFPRCRFTRNPASLTRAP